MKINRTNKIIVVAVIALLFASRIPMCHAQTPGTAISSSESQKILFEYKNNAEAYFSKNLNRFGLEQLKRYDRALDSLTLKEKEDTLAAIRKTYAEKNSNRLEVTDDLKSKSGVLRTGKEASLLKYHSLLRKAAITFFIWLAAVLLLLKFRNRAVRKSQLELDANLAQLKISQESFAQGETLFKSAADWQLKTTDIKVAAGAMAISVLKLKEIYSNEIVNGELFKLLEKNSEEIQMTAQHAESLSTVILRQQEEPSKEKQPIQINPLSEHYATLAHSEMLLDDGSYSCEMTTDFEKNLPSVAITPEPVGIMLLNILGNAFNSVKKKQERQIKGYIGKVSISTRILPRFIQIRVKDNGVGIPDEDMELIYEPFYSTQPVGHGAGLGLYFSREIIKENNGEMKIESDHENTTDVYIKFFLSHK